MTKTYIQAYVELLSRLLQLEELRKKAAEADNTSAMVKLVYAERDVLAAAKDELLRLQAPAEVSAEWADAVQTTAGLWAAHEQVIHAWEPELDTPAFVLASEQVNKARGEFRAAQQQLLEALKTK